MSSSVISATALLALLGTVILAMATAALSRQVRDLRAIVVARQGGSSPIVERSDFRWTEVGKIGAAVLFVTRNCEVCAERLPQFLELASSIPSDVTMSILSTDPNYPGALDTTRVQVISAPELVGELGLAASPTLLMFDRTGAERWRMLAGSKDSMSARLQKEWTSVN